RIFDPDSLGDCPRAGQACVIRCVGGPLGRITQAVRQGHGPADHVVGGRVEPVVNEAVGDIEPAISVNTALIGTVGSPAVELPDDPMADAVERTAAAAVLGDAVA